MNSASCNKLHASGESAKHRRLLLLALTALLLSAEEPAPAQGSVKGFFLFAELNATAGSNLNFRGPVYAPKVSAVGGYGGSLEGVRLSTTLRAEVAGRWVPFEDQTRINPLLFAVTLALPDAGSDRAGTGLRITPAIGVELSVINDPAPGDDRVSARLLTPWLGGQLERRFGPLELAYRLEARVMPVGRPAFEFAQRLLAEVWVVPSLSFAASLDWFTAWGFAPSALGRSVVPTNLARVRVIGSWNFSPIVGLVVEGTLHHAFAWEGLTFSDNAYSATVGFTFRTDALLERNWIDR